MKEKKKLVPRITHVMADGTIRDSIEGYEVPVNDQTKGAYMILAKWMREACDRDKTDQDLIRA